MTNHRWEKPGFLISTQKDLLQLERVHRFLSREAYWCLGVPRSVIEKSMQNSLCFGVYRIGEGGPTQVGYARVVSDFATFAWLCDVYIENEVRGQGLSKWLMECILSEPNLQNLRRICLATTGAHGLYAQFGFEVTRTPGNWMEIKDNEIYKKLSARN